MCAGRPDPILTILREAGHESYYVGGCVRDLLLGRPIHDWDITTSALPEQTMACFPHCVPTGIKHGTVTVLVENWSAEVTTFRADGAYSDGRHPDRVSFVGNLEDDLSRRDFTINAMAIDTQGNIVDLFGGKEDLDRKLIRCVGDPETRFREDALRILRAIRFSAQLGFTIEENTRRAIADCADLCRRLSVERVRDELEKTLLSEQPYKIEEMFALGLLETGEANHSQDYRWLESLPNERVVRWAGLCRILPRLDLIKLRLDKRTAVNAMAAGRCAVPDTTLAWKCMIAEYGCERARITAALCGCADLVEDLLSSGQCLSLKELAIKGSDLTALHGADVGNMLHMLLEHVLEHPENNSRKKLLEIYKNRIDSCYLM